MPDKNDPQGQVDEKLAETFDEPVTFVQGAEDTARQQDSGVQVASRKEDASTVTPLPDVVQGPLEEDEPGVHATISHGRQIITVADRLNATAHEAGTLKADSGERHCLYCGEAVQRGDVGLGEKYAVCKRCGNTVRLSRDALEQAFHPAGGARAVQDTDERSRGLARADEARAAARERQAANQERQDTRRAERDTRRADRAAEHGAKAD